MTLKAVLKRLKNLWNWGSGILFECMLFILWLLLFLLRPKKLNKSGYHTLRHILDTFDCLRCPIHCPTTHQESIKSTKQMQTPSRSSSHPVNPPVPPVTSRTKKPTRLQITRRELQEELNKPSNKVNIKRVKELHKEINELEEKWRERSTRQRRARGQRKRSTDRGTPSKPAKSQRRPPFFPSAPEKPPKPPAKLKTRKLTRLQSVCTQIDKELAKPPEHINIKKVKEFEKKKERLEQEWHNRSRAQKQAWRWRKKVAKIVKEKATEGAGESARTSGQFGASALDKKTCTRCPVHCPPVENIRRHWKNKLHDLLSDILRQLDVQNGFQDPHGAPAGHILGPQDLRIGKFMLSFLQKIARWIYQKWFQSVCFRS
jgi:hypothetical protein